MKKFLARTLTIGLSLGALTGVPNIGGVENISASVAYAAEFKFGGI